MEASTSTIYSTDRNFSQLKCELLLPPSRTLWNSRAVLNFLHPCRFFGVLVRATDVKPREKNRYISFLETVWHKVLIFLAISIAFTDTWKSVTRHKERLTSLEFTAMGLALHRMCKVTMVVIIAAGMGQFSRKAQLLMQDIEELNHEFRKFKTSKILIRQKLARLAAICWGVACAALSAGVIGVYATFQHIGARSAGEQRANCAWTCPQAFPIVQSLPTWAVFIAYSSMYSFTVGMVIFPQLMVLLLIYPLGLWFDLLRVSIRNHVSSAASPDRWVDNNSFHQIAAYHLKLTKVVMQVDQMFKPRCGLIYFNDLIGFIATVSLMLRHKTNLFDVETDLDLLPLFLTILGTGTSMNVLRTSFGVWMNEKAHAPLPLLYEMHLHCKSEEDKRMCTAFTSRLQGSRVALTVGGFFYITREFVITICGVLLTYVLFVYQMQDQKEDLSRLPRLHDLLQATSMMMQNLTSLFAC